MNNNLTQLKERINILPFDLRAEVVLAVLLDGLKKDGADFLVKYHGQFKRPYSKDVLNCEIIDYDYDATQFLQINLSRDGIYDTLPEGISHFPRQDKLKQSVEDLTKNSRQLKLEETAARKFFQPFENEFFLKGLEIEKKEKELLLQLNEADTLDFFYEFWGIEKDLPKALISKFIRLLPYTYKIVGKLELTAFCLSYLINEKVEIVELGYKEQADSEQSVNLGDCRLGLDMISGSSYMDYSMHLEFKIGPLENTKFHEYIHQGSLKKFIELFYEYFLPMEIDVRSTILLPKALEEFNFEKEPVLGITTRI